MASRSVSRNNLIAGTFLLVALIAGIVISIIVSGAHRRLTPRSEYIVRFSIAEGAPGLRNGANVTLGGQPVGWVELLDFHMPSAAPEGVNVHISIRADLTLFPDAVVHLERPLLGTMSTLNIAAPGDPAAGPPLPPGSVIPGMIAPPAILSQAGYGPDQSQQLRLMVEQAADTVSRMNRIVQSVEGSVDQDLGRMRAALEDLTAITADVRERIPAWAERVDSVLAQADRAAASFVPLSERAEAAVEDARRILRDVGQAVEENRASVNRIVTNMDEAAARLNRESVPLLSDALAQGRDGIAHFQEVGRMFNSLLLEQAPNLRRIFANFRLAADQFRLTSVEVRRNPWRLLYQPGTRELEAELFYDAARTYAQAVSDLREASESLEAIARADAIGRVAPTVHMNTVDDVQARLQDAFRRYEQAERDLLQQMIQRRR
jgi:ABC-type transporter Mla subunit MlaD